MHCVHYVLTWIVGGFWQGSIVSNHTRYLALTGNYANCCFASKLVNLSSAVSNLNAYWWLLYEYTNSTVVLSEHFFINYICTVWCCQSNHNHCWCQMFCTHRFDCYDFSHTTRCEHTLKNFKMSVSLQKYSNGDTPEETNNPIFSFAQTTWPTTYLLKYYALNIVQYSTHAW